MASNPPKLRPGDKVAVLSPSFAAPALFPAPQEQALRRIKELTGLIPVEFPTTRALDVSPEDRAADINAAMADPEIRAIFTTVGGDDLITVVPHLNAELLRADPKPFFGYSDNTNILNWMWMNGVAGFHGGATQVHLGPGPYVDPEHLASLTAALFSGEDLEITDVESIEDSGLDWADPRALVEFEDREPPDPWMWAGPPKSVTGRTWGGCLEVLDQIAIAGRMPSNDDLSGVILLLETSDERPAAAMVKRWVRALGERGTLSAVAGVVVADSTWRDVVPEVVSTYNPEAVVCVGPSFGHYRPQWILPYGGQLTLDGSTGTITASYR